MFASETDMAYHVRVTHSAPQFTCNECGKDFKRKYALTRHEAIHSGAKRYRCNCGKLYASQSGLKYHEKRCNAYKDSQQTKS